MKELFSIPVLPVVLTLLAYQAGAAIQKRTKSALCNPILLAVVLVALFLFGSGMELEDYQAGMKNVSWLMTPATVCLAIPMYEQYQELKKSMRAMAIGVAAGSAACIVMVWGLCMLFGLSRTLTVTLLPKSVTSAIGVPLAQMGGGLGSLCTAVIIVTGILGSVFGEAACKMLGLTDPVAQGVAFGTASHVVGTAKAGEISPLVGAVSSLSLVVAGLMTSVILSVLYGFL
ncbi:MAG: LrgB family protein [Oscillospiraceae bacterium]|nr:LrgB family protein [Oscillospiraceae bacterium]